MVKWSRWQRLIIDHVYQQFRIRSLCSFAGHPWQSLHFPWARRFMNAENVPYVEHKGNPGTTEVILLHQVLYSAIYIYIFILVGQIFQGSNNKEWFPGHVRFSVCLVCFPCKNREMRRTSAAALCKEEDWGMTLVLISISAMVSSEGRRANDDAHMSMLMQRPETPLHFFSMIYGQSDVWTWRVTTIMRPCRESSQRYPPGGRFFPSFYVGSHPQISSLHKRRNHRLLCSPQNIFHDNGVPSVWTRGMTFVEICERSVCASSLPTEFV